MSGAGAIPEQSPTGVPRHMLEERWALLSDAMDKRGLDAVVIAGRGLIGQYGDVFYLTGFPLFNSVGHGYAFLRAGGEVQLILGKRDQELALHFGIDKFIWRADMPDAPALGDTGLIEQVTRLIRAHGLARGRIGIVGRDLVMPAGDWISLRELLPDLEIEGASHLLANLKAVKSPAELELYAEACAIADEGFDTYVELVAPGRTEAELAAAVEQVVRRRGALATIIQVLTGRMYTRPPTGRVLREGEVVCCYVEVVAPNGYWVEKGGQFVLGTVTERWREVVEVGEHAYAAGERMLTPGTRADEIAATVAAIAAAGGCQTGIWSGHGVGIDHDRPLINGVDQTVLQEGMVVAFHPHICDEAFGTFSIDQYTVTEGGPVRHSRRERRLQYV